MGSGNKRLTWLDIERIPFFSDYLGTDGEPMESEQSWDVNVIQVLIITIISVMLDNSPYLIVLC